MIFSGTATGNVAVVPEAQHKVATSFWTGGSNMPLACCELVFRIYRLCRYYTFHQWKTTEKQWRQPVFHKGNGIRPYGGSQRSYLQGEHSRISWNCQRYTQKYFVSECVGLLYQDVYKSSWKADNTLTTLKWKMRHLLTHFDTCKTVQKQKEKA